MIPSVRLMHGDCRELIATLDDESVASIVTDPPYELGFMGKKWDNSGIAYDVTLWSECLRVLKPGGHLLAFGGTRTYHRMACAIEDAGFEIRDSIVWLYGSGFPKSLDVSKAIDKAAVIWRGRAGQTQTRNDAMAGPNYERTDKGAAATDAARQWDGWGTALKPAHEPIVVARKPLVGTVAANVQQHGTGAINIDGTRIATNDRFGGGARGASGFAAGYDGDGWTHGSERGRWPANVITDGSIDAEWARFFYSAKASKAERNAGLDGLPLVHGSAITGRKIGSAGAKNGGYAGTSETPKQNIHPTVKPLALMRYLVRLVTPPGGTVLEPFAGSGTTLAAAILEGFDAIGCELTEDYLPIIEGRIAWAQQERAKAHDSLFGDVA
jgi:site-specific DNA-methyltransferase (adenine-specific)